MEPGQTASRRRLPRTAIAGVLLIAIFAFIAFSLWRRPQRQAELIERVKAVGGFVTHDPPPSLQERISAYRHGAVWDEGYTSVRLYTADITGDWLRELDDLSALTITDLKLAETALTDHDLARLIRANPVHVVELRDEELGDETIAALAGSRQLFILEIRDSPLTDEQFSRLPLESFEELRIDGTAVTPQGLRELRRAGQLVALTIDGRQLDEETAPLLGRLPALRLLELVGEAVTDEHLTRLHALTSLEAITLRRTAATGEGVKQLEAVLPNCSIDVR